ncbi:uncharacterized protein G2W53_007671 [Senna tora]|uniref:Uncharacterized protein n=1 Tax=Senna tora TaxID=362788 RepID=A0A835CEG1_9FABA|nr:uncharacterized protein G2W53_007671 [Senna tora]
MESNTSVRVVFANRCGFDAPIGVILAWEQHGSFDKAWEDRGSCINIFRTTNRGQISETFTNYEEKDFLRKNLHELRGKTLVAQVSETRRFALYLRIGVVLMLQLQSSWHGRIGDDVLTYSGRQIDVGSQKPSRITRQKTCCASESNTSVRVVFANRSGFDAPIGVILAWVERGSCINLFRTTNRGRISETFMNYEAKDLLHSGRKITVGSQRSSRITRPKTCCASESNTSVRVVFANRSGSDAPIAVDMAWEERGSCLNIFRMTNRVANRSGFDAPIGVVLTWEERGSCLNLFWMTNRGRISETFMNYEAKDLLRKRKIVVGSHKPSRITRKKTCCASESNTSVRVVFANQSGFDAPIGVVMAWGECGSCLNIFRMTIRSRISETFSNYEPKDLLRKETRQFALYLRTGVVLMLQLESSWHGRSLDHVLTYSRRQIAVGSQKPSRITRQKTCCANSGRKITVRSQKSSRITRPKTCCASESNTSVRVVFENRTGSDAPIAVDMAWEERGSCLNIFRMTNRGRISETFTNYEAKDLLRNGFDAPIGVVLAWEERGSCLNIFRTTNHGRITETFTNYEGKDLLRKRQIAVGSQKPSRIMRKKTCCTSESNTSVRVVFANQSRFDAPIGVVMAWEERGSCLNIFQTTNRGRIS